MVLIGILSKQWRVVAAAVCVTILLVRLTDPVRHVGLAKPPLEEARPGDPLVPTEPGEKQEPHASRPFGIPGAPGTIPGVPGKVWHAANDDNFTGEQRDVMDSWLRKNPGFRHELLTTRQADNYVIANYNHTRPDIVALFTVLPIAILRADLLRYLILLSEGGIWSDLDVTCEVDVGHWLPADMHAARPEISLIVGLEFDAPAPAAEERPVHSQFASWVLAARAGSPHLQHVVDAVVEGLYDIARENEVGPSGITLDMISDVIDVTGPKKMTLAVLQSLSRMLGRTVDDRDVAGLRRPRLVGDVLVMPGAAFAAQQNHYPTDQGEPLVTHHYAGSWKAEADAARERRKKKEEKERERMEARDRGQAV
ncbi:Glycosyltransferase, DXD sugar-binding motif protein [Metarhizium album ARSEF 1941]|uniref:Glycosyltransferase, DXD sugar-binding motif protein n=1 Tax=Metarhizium album (strain ARSEF 1941) TaxID=1081103 RepID=A0A0B2WJM0_METAS|nr:Glycosyltransferase, DXD sugar-binding motif protein [Metarhizium album ARSEF 1941]KHN93889.1 Glycosyltransferase, DXD sugar-binding motif protein [Metarhizium album ARSEF 1941]